MHVDAFRAVAAADILSDEDVFVLGQFAKGAHRVIVIAGAVRLKGVGRAREQNRPGL
jgi:hypothetical protein